jgi:hypothetical protein
MPAMGSRQQQSWHALMDLWERLPEGWTLIGGQLVHLHCAERGASPARATNDVDAVVDVRAASDMLERFTAVLREMGFRPDTSGDGLQHRWRRDEAQIDVLLPEGIGERAASRHGVGGAPSLEAPGTTQALARSRPVEVVVGARTGTVIRPNLVAALIGKAAARTQIAADAAAARHCVDFTIMATLVSAHDFRETSLGPKDRQRLRSMLGICREEVAVLPVEGAREALDRLERAAGL